MNQLAPERKIFYVDTSKMSAKETRQYMDQIIEKMTGKPVRKQNDFLTFLIIWATFW